MTLSSGSTPSDPRGDRPKRRAAKGAASEAGARAVRGPQGDQDIRNHPLYKTPWWRRPLKPYVFWIIIGIMVAVVAAAVIVTLSLGIALF